MKWNDIPFDENASPEEKALEFDLQVEENTRGIQRTWVVHEGSSSPTTMVYGPWFPYGSTAD